MVRSNWILAGIGILYAAVGACFWILQDSIYFANINSSIMPYVINGITISSLMFAISDAIEQIWLKHRHIINLEQVLANMPTLATELEVYQEINCKYNHQMNIVNPSKKILSSFNLAVPILNWISRALATWAIAIGLFSIMTITQISAYTSTGFTIITFGLFILSFAYRELKDVRVSRLIDQIWFEYYKNQSTKNMQEETINE